MGAGRARAGAGARGEVRVGGSGRARGGRCLWGGGRGC